MSVSATLVQGDNLEWLQHEPSGKYDFIYIDPPFNTGVVQKKITQAMVQNPIDGDRVGFQSKRYSTVNIGQKSFADMFDDYLGWLEPRLSEAYRVLKPTGSLFLHLDYREVHYAKVLLDQIFGRASFMNELIWAYDYGAKSKSRWATKHDNILWYAKNPKEYTFNYEEIDRIPYMAPDLVGAEKAAKGKVPTDVHWHTIVPTNGKEKTGYPTQKPEGLLTRWIKVHSNPGDLVLDFFAGSGTTGIVSVKNDRSVVLVDESQEAISTIRERFKGLELEIDFLGDWK